MTDTNTPLAVTWEDELYLKLHRDRKIALIAAFILGIIAVLALLAVVLLLPLKTHVPYVLTVDSQTGYIEQTTHLTQSGLSDVEAVTKSNIARFILARETYDPPSVVENFEFVNLFSTNTAQADWVALWTPGNKAHPGKLYGHDTRVHTQIKSISFLNENTANIRFKTTSKTQNTADSIKHWVGIVQFQYVQEPLQMGQRLINPLGFQVTSYRKDQENL